VITPSRPESRRGRGRNDHHRHLVPGGHGRNQGQRTVATDHADHIGPAGYRGLGQSNQLLPRLHHNRFDAPCPAPLSKADPPRRLATASRVDQQHGVACQLNGPAGRRPARPGTGPVACDKSRHGAHESPASGLRSRAGSGPIGLPMQASITAPMTISPHSALGVGLEVGCVIRPRT
jgi:hypothetical protein